MAKPSFSAASFLGKSASWEREPRFAPLLTPAFPPLPSGLPRGCLVELIGSRSSGRTAAMLYFLACATASGETCAMVDLCHQFSPESAAQTGVNLSHLVWVRCEGKPDLALRSADLLLQAGGLGIIVLDLCEADPKVLHRIPTSSWYRLQRAIEHRPTTLLICADTAQAKSCAALHLELAREDAVWAGSFLFPTLQRVTTKVMVREKGAPHIHTLPIREVV